jgi:4-amino-4-deoxy-L-arabinose transferase-like glycosyltransferase
LSRSHQFITAALFVAMIVFHLWSLMRFPAPFVDEAWSAARAWAFIQTGHAFGSLDKGVLDRFEGYWTFFPWLPTAIQSVGMRLFATPELLSIRLVSLAFGLALLGAVYSMARDWGGPALGGLSVFLVSVSWTFLYSAHLARFDIMVAALGFVAIALYLHNRTGFWASGLAGLCAGLAFEIHPHGMIYAPALAVLYWWHWRGALFRRPQFWGFVTGVSLGLAFYAALHILPYPQTFVAINQLALSATHTPPILTLDARVIAQAIVDSGGMFLAVYQPLIPLILWAAVVLARRRTESDKTWLILSAVLVTAHTLLVRNKFLYYAILVTPALVVMVAAFLLDFVRQPWRGRWLDYVSRAAVGGLLIGSIALNLSVHRTDFGAVYRTTQSRINQVIRPGELIIGPQTYWLGLYDHDYYSWEELIYYQRYAPGSTWEDALREFHPDILVVDRFLEYFITDPDEPGDLYQQNLRLPRLAVESFLDRRTDLLTAFDSGYYGRVRVYRIAWDK